MSTHNVKGYVTYTKSPHADEPKVDFMTFKPTADYWPHTVIVREQEIEVEIPDDFNPVPQMVEILMEQKRLLRVALAEKLMAIDTQISKLTCLTNEVTS